MLEYPSLLLDQDILQKLDTQVTLGEWFPHQTPLQMDVLTDEDNTDKDRA